MTKEDSRLAQIRAAINGCDCVHCERMVRDLGARELLAVVDAYLDEMPLDEAVATMRELGHDALAAAWEALA